MAITGVIFDFDGTLTRPGAIDFARLRRAVGCPDGEDILAHVEALAPAERARALDAIDRLEVEFAAAAEPNAGAVELLRELRARGLPLGILTRNTRRALAASFTRFAGFTAADFAAVICRDHGCAPKPEPDGVRLAAAAMGVPCERCLLVGDFRYDIEAGNAAGAWTALLTNGAEAMACATAPDAVIHTLAEVPALLDRLGRPG